MFNREVFRWLLLGLMAVQERTVMKDAKVWLYLLGLVAAAIQDALFYVGHDKESAVSKVSLNNPRYTDQPALGST